MLNYRSLVKRKLMLNNRVFSVKKLTNGGTKIKKSQPRRTNKGHKNDEGDTVVQIAHFWTTVDNDSILI